MQFQRSSMTNYKTDVNVLYHFLFNLGIWQVAEFSFLPSWSGALMEFRYHVLVLRQSQNLSRQVEYWRGQEYSLPSDCHQKRNYHQAAFIWQCHVRIIPPKMYGSVWSVSNEPPSGKPSWLSSSGSMSCPPPHPWAECWTMYVSFSATTEEKKSHHMALYGHDAQIAPYVFPGVRRLADNLL